MPELPEVETIKREFAQVLTGRRIESVEVRSPIILDIPSSQFVGRVEGAEFRNVTRRAKYLVVDLSNGFSLIIHLKISGQLLYVLPDRPIDDYTHIIFNLDDGKQLRLRDVNSFASIWLFKTTDIPSFFAYRKMGPEPLSPNFTYESFRALIKRHPRAMIKPLLINQHFVAGIGSIYADEILFYARVHPARKVSDLSEEEIRRIYDGTRQILPEAISHRGTTTQFYLDLRGQKGEHQNYLKVHAKAGKPCEGCPGVVEKIELSGRGTYLCPSCQH
ncbi:MAG: bifunctional DNA-formamidopyrimidine glycosylase/DNA-(apurinic or apyrimidinic site) lyase [Actinobacteria bacterium]|nr:bifunctional DNA-formamidopyrimidine glycosylase/DNA-(apurinic or apyrimidinic site) lyase [Actinomycetota bacterium]